MKLTRASQIPIKPMRPAAHELLPLIPEQQRVLADGRATHSVLATMINEWRSILGGNAYLRFSGRWTFYSDDSMTPWGKRGPAQSAILCAISDHASARALVSGHKDGIVGNHGRMSYYSATAMRTDGVALALAVLDLELTGSTSLADWYLSSWCPGLGWHRHHGNADIPCGAGNCGTADPDTTCDCICKGVNHAMGEGAGKVGPAPALDWSTAPAPVWRPDAGTVEIEVADDWSAHMTHTRLAARSLPDPRYVIEGQAG